MSDPDQPAGDRLLTPREAAAMLSVHPKTVTRWATEGRVKAIRTVGGHRRYRFSDLLSAIREASADQDIVLG